MGVFDFRTFASIDIGSNGVRLFIGRVYGQKVQILEDHRESIRLGVDSFRHGKISPRSIQRLVKCFLEFRLRAEELGVLHWRAVATSALRDAQNGSQVIREIWRRTGINIELIDGFEEASLLHLAVSRALKLGPKKALMVDMGGGSLEVVLGQKGKMQLGLSLRLGTVRLLERFGPDAEYSRYAHFVHKELSELIQSVDAYSDLILTEVLVGAGGSIKALGRLAARLHGHPVKEVLTYDELENLSDVLFSLRLGQRIQHLSLKPDRADVIRPAAVILLELMRAFNFAKLLIPNVGIKNGVFWQLAEDVLITPQRGIRTLDRQTSAGSPRYKHALDL